MDLDNMLQRIDQLLEKGETKSEADISEIATETTTLFESAYGRHSTQLDQVLILQKLVYEGALADFELVSFRERLYGCLQALKSDATEGRIVSFQLKVRGEVCGDFIVLAHKALDEGQKNVAAVLACAALEDSLKQYAKSHSLDVGDEEMATVVNALKSVGAIDKADGTMLKAYTQVRNKAFHAQWDAIDIPKISSVLVYTEEFLKKHFSNQPL